MFIGELIRQKPSTRPKKIDRIRNGRLDRNDLNFQHISWFCTLNPDRTRQNVRNITALLHLAIDRKESRLNLVSPQTGRLQSLHGESDQRFKFNDVPGTDSKCRRRPRVEVAPGNRLRRGQQTMVALALVVLLRGPNSGRVPMPPGNFARISYCAPPMSQLVRLPNICGQVPGFVRRWCLTSGEEWLGHECLPVAPLVTDLPFFALLLSADKAIPR